MTLVFSDEAVENFGESYRTHVRPKNGGCMKAVYFGLSSLFGNRYGFRGDFHKTFFKEARKQETAKQLSEGSRNTIDRVFRALEKEDIVFPEQVFKPTGQGWTLDNTTSIPSLEGELVAQANGLPSGSHFFGVAINDAIHSLIVRIDTTGAQPRVFWMDQFSNGYDDVFDHSFVSSPDVTGRLDEEVRSFGSKASGVWLFNPNAAAGVTLQMGLDEDGFSHFQPDAVVDVDD